MRISDWSSDVCSSDLLDAAVVGARRQQFADALDQLAEHEGNGLDVKLAGLDLGKVEDVIDHRQQGASGIADHLRHAALFAIQRSEEHTSELQSLMRISYAVFCLKNKSFLILSCHLYDPLTVSRV